jgi:hypothetical protein
VFGATNDRREHSARGVIASKASLAHSRAVVDDQGSENNYHRKCECVSPREKRKCKKTGHEEKETMKTSKKKSKRRSKKGVEKKKEEKKREGKKHREATY